MLVELVAPLTNALGQLQSNINMINIAKSNTMRNEQIAKSHKTESDRMKVKSQDEVKSLTVNETVFPNRDRNYDFMNMAKPYVPEYKDRETVQNIEYLNFEDI